MKVGLLAVVIAVAISALGAGSAATRALVGCGNTITTNTTLTSNLNCSGGGTNGLNIGADGITLNLNGHSIIGAGGADNRHGVENNAHRKVTIKNGSIEDFAVGVFLDDVNKNTVKDVHFVLDGTRAYSGVQAQGGGSRNVFTELSGSNALHLVFLTAEHGALVCDSVADDSESPFVDGNGANNVWQGNKANNSTDTSFTNTNSQFTLWKGNVSKGSLTGFFSTGPTVLETFVDNKAIGGDIGFESDHLGDGRATFTGNVANGTLDEGIKVVFAYYDNGSTNCASCPGSTLSGNTSNGNGGGFYALNSYNSTWDGNEASHNTDTGFEFESGTRGYVVTHNVAVDNDDGGIVLRDNSGIDNARKVAKNSARNNRADDDDGWGLYADFQAPGKDNHASGNTPGNCQNVNC